ncbi:response regulator transcription factor [Saccharopolyspora elongata]|uniref:Response regulator transcription factor n=1 Tax=Saccharopolyspora elongata TaxID=2530387 RepID=A0A4R4YE55_9PSEU|nr:response regulator transcription factor [Saccharopolyspora elongata]TDD42204.1 response regulator transcription factor [Saccharopolyspora elongata]
MFPTRASGHAVLVVDDDERIRRLAAQALREGGFDVSEAGDGRAAFEHVRLNRTDLVVLDIGLPGVDGLDLLHQFRGEGDIPIILLTARRGETDRVLGLELGADDYVTKPFSSRELVARVRTVLRRSGRDQRGGSRLEFDGLVIDGGTREVIVNGEVVELTAKEFDLLAHLASAPRQVFSRRQLLQAVWHAAPDWQAESTVTEHIHRLRHKIENDASRPRRIRTVRGVGYRFEP